MRRYNLRILNLRDFQEAIERGEYDTFPVKEWMQEHAADTANEAAMYICPYDGTIHQEPGDCPSPYHPHPRPGGSNRVLRWLIVVSVCFAAIYSILNNEALVTLIVTVLLLIITAIVFAVLFVTVIYIWAKVAPERVERGRKLVGQFSALLSGFFAMIIVSILQGRFPPLHWWIIEFAVAFVLEHYVGDFLTGLVFRFVLPDYSPPKPDDSLEKLVYKCAELVTPQIAHRLLFFVSSLALGFWFLSPVLYEGRLPPLWVVPFVFVPFVIWLWTYYQRFFTVLGCPELVLLLRQEPVLPLCLDVFAGCAYAVLKPTERECNDHWWLSPLFYVFLLLPVGCHGIALVTFS